MEWVFNEWFLEYMVPGHANELTVSRIIDSLEAKGDVLLVRRICPFTAKHYSLSKLYSSVPQNLLRRFHRLMRDPGRVRIVEESQIRPLPSELAQSCPPEDVYLVEVACVGENKTIVTTDGRFISRVNGREGITLISFEEFVGIYL